MPDEAPISALMVQILDAQARDRNFTVNALIDNYTSEIATLRATLDAIRVKIQDLYSNDWTPSERAVLEALYPRSSYVDQFRHEDEMS